MTSDQGWESLISLVTNWDTKSSVQAGHYFFCFSDLAKMCTFLYKSFSIFSRQNWLSSKSPLILLGRTAKGDRFSLTTLLMILSSYFFQIFSVLASTNLFLSSLHFLSCFFFALLNLSLPLIETLSLRILFSSFTLPLIFCFIQKAFSVK